MYGILSKNGYYYQFWTGIGPCFGGDVESAARFKTLQAAKYVQSRHFIGFVCTKIVNLNKPPVTWSQRAKLITGT